jgi:DNA-binding LacI/PurR family transcriptional regulator
MSLVTVNRTPGRRPTIRDVAARAGVSHQTVSRVINGRDNVTAETRDRVRATIRELQYVPSPLARGLMASRTHSLGMVTADVTDNTFAQAVAGAELETRRRGYYLIVASVEGETEDDEVAYLRLMLERRVEGLIVFHPQLPLTPEQLPPAVERVPLVSIGSSALPGFMAVDVDNRGGGFEATTFLIRQGHRLIATITGPQDWPSARARLEGYRDAFREAGLPYDETLVEAASDWGPETGQEALARLARTGRFTAVFAHSDLLALGAIRELRSHGLAVPDDVSVIGYDDIPVASFVEPPLTTVRQPMREVGTLAAKLLLDRITGNGGVPVGGRVHLPTTLVERGSVAAPRQATEPVF